MCCHAQINYSFVILWVADLLNVLRLRVSISGPSLCSTGMVFLDIYGCKCHKNALASRFYLNPISPSGFVHA